MEYKENVVKDFFNIKNDYLRNEYLAKEKKASKFTDTNLENQKYSPKKLRQKENLNFSFLPEIVKGKVLSKNDIIFSSNLDKI